MDIYELRRKINVYNFGHHVAGVTIFYKVDEQYSNVCLDPETLAKELDAIGSLDSNYPGELANYTISQWDALNIAIRFELARAMDKELDNSDIGKAIKNITNGQTDAY